MQKMKKVIHSYSWIDAAGVWVGIWFDDFSIEVIKLEGELNESYSISSSSCSSSG